MAARSEDICAYDIILFDRIPVVKLEFAEDGFPLPVAKPCVRNLCDNRKKGLARPTS